jgi:hypothetical protein
MQNLTTTIIAIVNFIVLFLLFSFRQHGQNSSTFFFCMLFFSGLAWGLYFCKKVFKLQKKSMLVISCVVVIYLLALAPSILYFGMLRSVYFDMKFVFIPWLIGIAYFATLSTSRFALICIILSSAAILLWPVARVFSTLLRVSL